MARNTLSWTAALAVAGSAHAGEINTGFQGGLWCLGLASGCLLATGPNAYKCREGCKEFGHGSILLESAAHIATLSTKGVGPLYVDELSTYWSVREPYKTAKFRFWVPNRRIKLPCREQTETSAMVRSGMSPIAATESSFS